MRTTVVVLVLLIGCDNKKSAPPAPPVGGGSGAGSAAVAPAMDATVVDAAMPAAPAPPAAAATITITADGLSSMPSYKLSKDPKVDDIADIQSKLAAVPGLTVSQGVMEYAGEVEEGYFSVKQGTEEVAQLFGSEGKPLEVRVVGPIFPTAEGVRTGDKVTTLVAKYPDLVCEARPAKQGHDLGLLQCRSKQAAGLVFVLNGEHYKGKPRGKLDLAKLHDFPIYMIASGSNG